MTQQRYYAVHHDSRDVSPGVEPPSTQHPSAPRGRFRVAASSHPDRDRQQGLPAFVAPGPQAGELSSLRFLEPRRLRRFDVDGPSPMVLTINGQPIGVVRPGENTFDPPVPLNPGDILQLEMVGPDDPSGADGLTGWTSPAPINPQPGQDR